MIPNLQIKEDQQILKAPKLLKTHQSLSNYNNPLSIIHLKTRNIVPDSYLKQSHTIYTVYINSTNVMTMLPKEKTEMMMTSCI